MVKQLQVETLYGLTVETDVRLIVDPPTQELVAAPDVTITELPAWQDAPFQPTQKTQRFEKRDPHLQIHVQEEWFCLRYPGVAEFFVRSPDRILFRRLSDVSSDLLASLLKGPAFSVLLELRGTICLHASAVRVGQGVVGFLGNSGQGKSTLAAEFVSHGFPLVTDDVLPVELEQNDNRVWPSFPELKLMPRDATDHDSAPPSPAGQLKQIHSPEAIGGASTNDVLPLTHLFVLHRDLSCDRPRIEKQGLAEQFVQLSRYRFCIQASQVLGVSRSRFYELGRLVRQISVWRLCYGHGFDKLPGVRQALLQHLNVEQFLYSE